jgi:hypothetical protein
VVDLHPATFQSSVANDVSGPLQVGRGTLPGDVSHALLWAGSASSVVDLHPSGFDQSYGEAAYGGQQVGWATVAGTTLAHALLWNGTAGSVVDLNPAGHNYSIASDLNATMQIDLHQYLADLPLLTDGSVATGIAEDGTIVGTAFGKNNELYAVIWTPVPEPCSSIAIVIGQAAALLFNRRCRALNKAL